MFWEYKPWDRHYNKTSVLAFTHSTPCSSFHLSLFAKKGIEEVYCDIKNLFTVILRSSDLQPLEQNACLENVIC